MKTKLGVGILIGMFWLGVQTVEAEEALRVNFDVLQTTDTWLEGSLGVNEYHYHPLEISCTGKLDIRVQSFFEYCRIDILDADLVPFASQQYINGNAGSPATVDFTFYVEPGTYYARCTGEAGYEGEYRIKAVFEEVECTENGSNDDYKSAQVLQEGVKVLGVHTRNDAHDYYSFDVGETKDVKLTVNVPDSYQTHLLVYDEDMLLLDEIYDGVAWAEEKTYVYEKKLDPGTYYVDMTSSATDIGGGPYWIRLGEIQEDISSENMEKAALK